METFQKYWGILVAVIGVTAGAFGWIYNKGADSRALDGRTFDTTEQKVYTIKKVEDMPSPSQERERSIFDSLATVKTTELLETVINDSRSIKSHIHHLDSINMLNADQMYQIKEEIKKNHNLNE